MSMYSTEKGYDMFDDEDTESDNDGSSSDDEIDIMLHGTPEQRRKLQHIYQNIDTKKKPFQDSAKPFSNGDSSSEDEFEKEMNAELDMRVKSLEDQRQGQNCILGASISTPSGSNQGRMRTTVADKFYDDLYDDSDEETEDVLGGTQGTKKKKAKQRMLSNDELLYDPDMDDEDQKWVDGERRKHMSRTGGGKNKKQMMPNSDALLDCPACMTTLCIDCQRHETYKHQYRAMFVMNCLVDTTESLECPEQASKKQRKKKLKSRTADPSGFSSGTSSDLFHPVKCTECNTVVGVIDSDEVYHFFNVLASYT